MNSLVDRGRTVLEAYNCETAWFATILNSGMDVALVDRQLVETAIADVKQLIVSRFHDLGDDGTGFVHHCVNVGVIALVEVERDIEFVKGVV